MGVLLYTNGLTEDYRPKELIFSEEEIVSLFSEFKEIKTCRIVSVLNTWCIYGASTDLNEHNKIATVIAKEFINSYVLFVHDSELDPKWNASDNILYSGYDEFLKNMKKLIDDAAINILNEIEMNPAYENKVDALPQLVTLGSTNDKRILFGFNPEEQTKEFYNNEEFYKFSQKVYEFLSMNKQEKEPFTIYVDKKAIIIIEKTKVTKFLNTLLEKFKSEEDYEICNHITKMMKDWSKIDKPQIVRKSRKKSSSDTKNEN